MHLIPKLNPHKLAHLLLSLSCASCCSCFAFPLNACFAVLLRKVFNSFDNVHLVDHSSLSRHSVQRVVMALDEETGPAMSSFSSANWNEATCVPDALLPRLDA